MMCANDSASVVVRCVEGDIQSSTCKPDCSTDDLAALYGTIMPARRFTLLMPTPATGE